MIAKKFSDLVEGDRFSYTLEGRLWQKVGMRWAIDLSEGRDDKGRYFKDSFPLDDRVMVRNEKPKVTDFDNENFIPGL